MQTALCPERARATDGESPMSVHCHGVFEWAWQAPSSVADPAADLAPVSEWDAPSGRTRRIRAFWDGGRVWRVRFSPDEVGRWRGRLAGESAGGARLTSVEIQCVPYEGSNPLYQRGPVRVAPGGRHLEHADGTPFLWLGDTAWNGVIRGDDANWRRYLEMRARQRFSVIQFVATDWRGDSEDAFGEHACASETPFRINPAFFQRLDRRVAMINEFGLLAAPVALWTLLKTDVGQRLSEESATQLAAYVVARYDAYQVCWLLGGDGNYQKIGVERWRRIGRAVFADGHDRLATLHPCGQNWVGEEFRNEPWYDIIGYQSGHGDGADHLAWLVRGPPAKNWGRSPAKPVINLEPNYETAYGYQHGAVFDDSHVRRAAWWSLLISPTAGLTYGHDAIWNWNFETGPSEGHGNWHGGAVPPWHTGLDTPGIRSMTVLRGILERLDWPTLRPAPETVINPPDEQGVTRHVAAARAADGTFVAYVPAGGLLQCAPGTSLPEPVRIVDPRSGAAVSTVAANAIIEMPDSRDWLVVAGPGWRA